jgi:tetratricopeptide (TPR) repeat protein
MEQLREMLVAEPNDPFLNYALALEFVNCNELEKAINLLHQIIISSPNYLGSYYQLGKLLEEVGQKEKAMVAYQQGIVIAQKQKNQKTLAELNQALEQLADA